jgi:hypothetical protein
LLNKIRRILAKYEQKNAKNTAALEPAGPAPNYQYPATRR